MPNFTTAHLVLLIVALVAGLLIGWLGRGRRVVFEKKAINASWKEQVDAQRSEHKRLLDQNQSLMQQVSQYQASQKDATNRSRELSTALKEALARRDELQRDIKVVRSNLESVVAERRQLETNVESLCASDDSRSTAIREKDDKIFRMSRELESWQDRLPPLIERYRERDLEARRLSDELEDAHERIASLQKMLDTEQTRVEPADVDTLSGAFEACNDTDSELNGDDEAPESDTNSNEYVPATFEVRLNGARSEYASPIRNGSAHGATDDLKAIKGVGPAIEKTLHELGITRYSQIADMSEYDINRVADRLKGFRTRIYREDWIGQARLLLLERAEETT